MYPGIIKQTEADWQVRELSSLDHAGEGEHAYFYIRKTARNTLDVVRDVAEAFDVARLDVGYAGRKDKQGITEQWLSVRTTANEWPEIEGTQCLKATRHSRKLRIGELAGNQFKILVRDATIEPGAFAAMAAGFPNAFGPQRVTAANIEQASHWLLSERERIVDRRRGRSRARRNKDATEGWHLSVLRSYLFNLVLAARQAVQAERKTGIALLDGDVLNSGFATAPLWGRGRSSTRAAALDVEQAALAPHVELCEALEHAGVRQARRALWVKPHNLNLTEVEPRQIELSFSLPPGAYATALLAHAGSCR